MRGRTWYLGLAVGLASGLLVSIPITVLDWRLNPSGVFHDDEGTDWGVVTETLLSWFWPVALGALIITVAVHAWIARGNR